MKIIGLAGTLSSGKDTLANFLEEKHGYMHISTGDMLRAAKKQKYGDSPEALLRRGDPFANNLRRERGPGILVDLAIEEYKKSNKPGLVVSGIRSIGEAEAVKAAGKLVFVDANPKIRYERGQQRRRDLQDSMSYEDFLKLEAVESEGLDQSDKTIQNLPAMKRLADIVLYNDEGVKKFLAEARRTLDL